MRMNLQARRYILVCAALLLAASPASAGVRVVKGGPTKKAAKHKVVTALGQVGDLSVCWRGHVRSPARVQVEIVIGKRGRVVRAQAKGRDAIAQCVAGVLAVQQLVGCGKKYTMVVELDSSGGGGGGMDAIKRELRPYRDKLNACSKPTSKGAVQVGFLIRPDGRVVDVEIKASTLASPAVERCLVDTMKAARLSARPNGKTVSFSMALNFAGGAGGSSSAKAPAGSLRPSKDGPVSSAALSKVMNENKAAFSACYDKQARKDPKLAGRVVMRFTIRDNGTVRNVKIRKTTLGNSKVEGCIVAVGKKLRFPGEKGRKKTRVIYPFEFSRQ
jgi:TonB family protein